MTEIYLMQGRRIWTQSVPSAVADGCAAGNQSQKAAHPSATADGTKCVQVWILSLEQSDERSE
jgi:hypothetical protein